MPHVTPQDSLEGEPINPECVVESMQMHFELLMKVEEAGHYLGCVQYSGQKVGTPFFTIICVTGKSGGAAPASGSPLLL